MAESAARAGGRVVAVDFFGDRDQARAAESYALRRDLGLPATAAGLARAARRLGATAVIYGANLENHPGTLAALARSCEVLGNEAAVVRRVRDWRVLRRFCAEAGIACPTTLVAGEESYARDTGGVWLRKRVRSGGGHGMGRWDGAPLDRAHLLQEEVAGRPASAAFVADGRSACLFALSEQLHGDGALGARGFAWCGNILPFAAGGDAAPGDARDAAERLRAAVAEMATSLTRRFGLRGVNGLDLVIAEGAGGELVPFLVEVNPRFTASMELAERLYGLNVFTLHLEGCAGRLPPVVAAGESPAAGFYGKAVVFAPQAVVTPDTSPWLDETIGGSGAQRAHPAVGDIPRSGARIAVGHPVCTVFAAAPDHDACLAALHKAAATINERLRHGGRRREVRREATTHADQRTHA